MKEIGLYIHIPFCKQKCLYCDFPSYAGKEGLINEYVDALNKEILKKGMDYIIASIFIGGGTPSYLDEENLERLLKTINKLKFKLFLKTVRGIVHENYTSNCLGNNLSCKYYLL